MMHYSDKDGYNVISSQIDWRFEARQPSGERPFGAFFTTLRIEAHRFSARTRIPKVKQEYVFAFTGQEGLQPLDGDVANMCFSAPCITSWSSRDRYIMVS